MAVLSSYDGSSAWATEGSGDEIVEELHAFLPHELVQARHVVEGVCGDILVIRQQEYDVRLGTPDRTNHYTAVKAEGNETDS